MYGECTFGAIPGGRKMKLLVWTCAYTYIDTCEVWPLSSGLLRWEVVSYKLIMSAAFVVQNGDCEEGPMDDDIFFRLGKTVAETHEMLVTACGDVAVTMKTEFKWFQRFRDGQESVEDDERSGCSSTFATELNISTTEAAVHEDQRLTSKELTRDFSVPYVLVQ